MSRANSEEFEQTNSEFASGFPADLMLSVNRAERHTLSEQLREQLRTSIHEGRIAPGTVLPASRSLARDLGVSRSVVVQAYELLAADGFVAARQGSTTHVLQTHSARPRRPAQREEIEPAGRFVSGVPDPRLFPRARWIRRYHAALAESPSGHLNYPAPDGVPELREELTDYLGRVRGVVTSPHHVLVSAGITQALSILSRALVSHGIFRVAVENPSFALHRSVMRNAGVQPVPVHVDDEGLVVDALPDDVGAVLATPAHSYPTGAVLSPERRHALVRWAGARSAVIIEDDYDAEFRYDRASAGALQGLAPDRVVYCGGVSKTLTPALRLGWTVLPSEWVRAVRVQKLLDDMGSPVFEQLAMARFIRSGDFTRHLRQVRPLYRKRRDATISAISRSLPGTRATGIDAGLHLYVELPDDVDEQGLVDTAAAQGVLIEGARRHFSGTPDGPALVIGYGSLNESEIEGGISTLGEVYSGCRRW